MEIVDLTRLIQEGMTTFHTDIHSDVRIDQLGSIAEHGRETHEVTVGTHTGTHLDSPQHFIYGGRKIQDISLEELVGPVELIDFTHVGENEPVTVSMLEDETIGKRTILQFGWEYRFGDSDAFYNDYPYLAVTAAQYLVDEGIELLGFDTPSPDASSRPLDGGDEDSPVHKVFLRNDVILVEYLMNLNNVDFDSQWNVAALPLKIKNADGAPTRVIVWKVLITILICCIFMSTENADEQDWLIEWFDLQTVVNNDTLRNNTDVDYLQEGWIDSMQFIGLISSIENEFDIQFSNDEFQNRSFATISGLAQMIADKSNTDS
jgi:arylformamidase